MSVNLTLLWGLATLLAVIGLWLVSRVFLFAVSDLATGTAGYLRRRLRPVALEWLREIEKPAKRMTQRETGQMILRHLATTLWFWVALGALGALLLSDRMFSPVLFTISLVAGEIYRSSRQSKRLRRLNEDTGNLVLQFEARFPVLRSVLNTLDGASHTLPKSELRRAVDQTIERLKLQQMAGKALSPLEKLPNPVLRRFVVVIANAQETDPEVFQDTLSLLRREVESRLDLGNRVRQNLTTLRSTTRILQAVLAGAMLAVCILPTWRAYFVASSQHWLLLLVMLFVGALGSFYVEAEIRQLEA